MVSGVKREYNLQYSTVQYSTVQYSTVQTVQYSTVLYSTVQQKSGVLSFVDDSEEGREVMIEGLLSLPVS